MPKTTFRKRIFNKTNGRCYYCGRALDVDDFHMDHFFPKSDGGKANYKNLVPSCPFCNLQKSDLNIEGFRNKLTMIFKEKIVFYFEDENLEIPEPPKTRTPKEWRGFPVSHCCKASNNLELEPYFKNLTSKNLKRLKETSK